MATTRPATLPAVKARMRNRLSWNIGSAILVSITANAASSAAPPDSRPMTPGFDPAHGVVPVGLDAHGDADQDGAQADREGDVAPPVDPARVPLAVVPELAVGPQRAEHAHWHVDPEHRPPVDRGQQAAGHQADELAGQPGHLVGAQREAAPVGRECVGQDRGRVRHQHGAADGLEHPPADQPHRALAALEGIEGEQDGGCGEHRETRVVDLDPAEHVAEAAQGDHQHRLDQPVTHDHPEQVADVARRQRVQVNAAEDGRQRDDDDGAVQRGHEHRRGRVGQGHPPVPVPRVPGAPGHQPPGHRIIICRLPAIVLRCCAPAAQAVARPPSAGRARRS